MMPVPACKATRISRGFTLLEVLMVVLLVGIISGIAMLSLSPGGAERKLQDESDRLATLLQQAADEAVMQNQEYGLKITGNGYRFLCLDEVKQRWKPCKNDQTFREREMPEGLEVHVLREGKMTLPLSEENSKDTPEERQNGPRINPDVFLLSSGEASPASLEIVVSDKPEIRQEIRLDELGRVHRDGDPEEARKGEGRNDVR